MKCIQCNNPLGEKDKFCKECGKQRAVEDRKCPSCGHTQEDNGKFCTECGEPMQKIPPKCKCGKLFLPNQKFCGECGVRQLEPKLVSSNSEEKSNDYSESSSSTADVSRVSSTLPEVHYREHGTRDVNVIPVSAVSENQDNNDLITDSCTSVKNAEKSKLHIPIQQTETNENISDAIKFGDALTSVPNDDKGKHDTDKSGVECTLSEDMPHGRNNEGSSSTNESKSFGKVKRETDNASESETGMDYDQSTSVVSLSECAQEVDADPVKTNDDFESFETLTKKMVSLDKETIKDTPQDRKSYRTSPSNEEEKPSIEQTVATIEEGPTQQYISQGVSKFNMHSDQLEDNTDVSDYADKDKWVRFEESETTTDVVPPDNLQTGKESREPSERKENEVIKMRGERPASPHTKYRIRSVVFHVIISKNFNLRDGDKVCIVLFSSRSRSVVMEKISSDECGCLYVANIDIPRAMCKYKYAINARGNYHYEKVYFNKDEDVRNFSISRGYLYGKNSGRIFLKVYDGMAYPPGMEGLLKKIYRKLTSSQDVFYENTISATRMLLPSLQEITMSLCAAADGCFSQSAEEYMECIDSIFCELQLQIPRFVEAEFSEKCIIPYLFTPLMHHVGYAEEKRPVSVTLAMFIFLLVNRWEITLKPEDKNRIFRAFLIKPNRQRRECQDLTDLQLHFTNEMDKKQIILKQLLFFINDSNDCNSDPSWLFCIPLLHFLQEDVVPFQEKTPSSCHNISGWWWGTEHFEEKVAQFKAVALKKPWSIPVDQTYEYLEAAFEADSLMIRTFVATLNCDQLLHILSTKRIPLEVILASIYFYVFEKKIAKLTREIDQILETVHVELQHSLLSNSPKQVDEAHCNTVIAIDLLDMAIMQSCEDFLIYRIVLITLLLMDQLTRCQMQQNSRELSKQYEETSERACKFIRTWIDGLHFNESKMMQMAEGCLQICTGILCAKLKDYMKDLFINAILQKIDQLSTNERLKACLCPLQDDSDLQQAISKRIFRYLPSANKEGDLPDLDEQQLRHFCRIMSCLLQSTWKSMVDNEAHPLQFVLGWEPLVHYFRWKNDTTFMNSLTKEASNVLQYISSIVEALMERLSSADIRVWEVVLLNNHQDRFSAIASTFIKSHRNATTFLRMRTKEVEAFKEAAVNVERCLAHCQRLTEKRDTRDVLQKVHDMNTNINDMSVKDICENPPRSEKIYVETYMPKVKIMEVPEEFQPFIPRIRDHLESSVFCHMLETEAKDHIISCKNKWWEALIHMWSEATKKWDSVCNEIRSGDVTLEDVHKLFPFVTDESQRFKEFESELLKMAVPPNNEWVKERLKQMKYLSDLTTLIKAAETICKLKEDYQFAGHVDDIERFLKVDMKQKLRHFDWSTLGTSEALFEVSRDCTFIQNLKLFGSEDYSQFIIWVRETMREGGLREVKVFVDLALNYVGDNPMDMDKVRNLQAAITGYAPLIFQLDNSNSSFLECCQDVCRNIAADRLLPSKLESTVQLLSWFKVIHDFHGSVEKTALAQVNSICSRGILKVGRVLQQGIQRMGIQLADVVCLYVPKEKEEEAKTYNYMDLVDLQSRLMLVVGHAERGQENVERFLSVMDSVERLAKLYIQLCHDGCILFLTWTVQFFCDTTRPVCCITEFFQAPDLKKMKGLLEPHSLEKYIAELATYLDECRNHWLIYVADKRLEHMELNMYTMEQLVFLQEQLVHTDLTKASQQVFPLLSLLKPACTSIHAVEAIQEATLVSEKIKEDEEEYQEEDPAVKEAARFIQHMQDNGFTKQLASKAIEHLDDLEDLAGGVAWCMRNEDAEEDNGSDEEESNSKINGASNEATCNLMSRQGTIASALKLLEQQGTDGEMTLNVMVDQLKKIWKKFLQTVKYSGEDCLSLHHLGLVLECLAKQDTREFKRKLPDNLKLDQPHLILCSKREVLVTVTSLYTYTENAPLPQPDEVLLCTAETTKEEVEIFLHRTFSHTSSLKGKLFCMAFADNMDYDVSETAVQTIKKYVGKTEHPYQLVVVCTTENEFKAHITAALDNYRSPQTVTFKAQTVLNYLHTKFKVNESLPVQCSAAFVDPERLCVRMVKSTRSGMGKTLYAKRLADKLKVNLGERKTETFQDILSDDDIQTKRNDEELNDSQPEEIISDTDEEEEYYSDEEESDEAHSYTQHSDEDELNSKETSDDDDIDYNVSPDGQLHEEQSNYIEPDEEQQFNEDLEQEEENVRFHVMLDTEENLSSKSESVEEVESNDQEECENLEMPTRYIRISLYEKSVNSHYVASRLMPYTQQPDTLEPRIIHLDISYEVQEGVDLLLYGLLVLGCITDNQGHVWLRSSSDLYILEAMPFMEHFQETDALHQIFSFLPSVRCWSPCETLSRGKDWKEYDLSFDDAEFRSDVYQRCFHYLRALEREEELTLFKPPKRRQIRVHKKECLQTLIRHCGVMDPSWTELHHFVSFLNKQLQDFEHSEFCGLAAQYDSLPGFSKFVLRFLIHMSKDFATRSLVMAEESLAAMALKRENANLEKYKLRRTWESSPHPYIFFNPDQHTMTFLGFTIDQQTGSLLDQNGLLLEENIMSLDLYYNLVANGVPLTENFDTLPRCDRLQKLYQVMGLSEDEMTDENNEIIDPDDTYELTTDNVKKILAIYMRMRCEIPVIVMGETGCGKTRLVKFMCALQTPKIPTNSHFTTMILMKVHGGTTAEDIQKKVKEAEELSTKIRKQFSHRPVYTILFFDEANTTETVGAIKEVMCDATLNGKPIRLHQTLKLVAACNPYRKHSADVIMHLEQAGLGYHVSAEETTDKLGQVPMRQLVYRVQPLPPSMLPLAWDFGHLNCEAEHIYIKHMVQRYKRHNKLGELSDDETETVCEILMKSQIFMRKLTDECSFVSLRDADRALTVCSWFLQQRRLLHDIRERLDESEAGNDITMSLVLALGVCYRAGLRKKEAYDIAIAPSFNPFLPLHKEETTFSNILDKCGDIILENVKLGPKIARNQALKENVFMMVVCVELNIPLFLVGKPGSSKSLAKSIVADAMQGAQAPGVLFKSFKEVQMVSFQCSPLATADGILATFRQCAHIQQGIRKTKEKFVSVAVLDEVGLAEDSPKMPLKALHPLLEEGIEIEGTSDKTKKGDVSKEELNYSSDGADKDIKFEKVAFIGISNWALDPAKMNRGILVQREVPDEKELVETARGICNSGEEGVLEFVDHILEKLARAYLNILKQEVIKREFFGLRDFYSMVKMVHAFATHNKRNLTREEFKTVFLRNFGGLSSYNPVPIFEKEILLSDCSDAQGIDYSYTALLSTALLGDSIGGESRYLLLLTENYGGLRILTDNLLGKRTVEPIFGSSFPKDQEYIQVCSNINRIKVCMETGKVVILLNLDNLYESLYDALNQYYSMLAGVRYVDLGLGSHRVKCKVHKNFRLIVVAEKNKVYERFPIPLINRLEKHFLTVSNILSEEQRKLQNKLAHWVKEFVEANAGCIEGDLFMGFHPDTTASIILSAWEENVTSSELTPSGPDIERKIMTESKATLLWCATPDAVIRKQDAEISHLYFNEQQHDDLAQYLNARLKDVGDTCLMAQVTTHSKMLTENERGELKKHLPGYEFTLLSLQTFHTKQQFMHQLRLFLGSAKDTKNVLLVQCQSGNMNQTLLQCAQYCVQCAWADQEVINHHVVFIVQLSRIDSTAFTGFQGVRWHCVHVDELRPPAFPMPSLAQLQSNSPAQLLSAAIANQQRLISDEEGNLESSLTIELVRDLLKTCVQTAMASILDTDEEGQRATYRITVLLQYFEDQAKSAKAGSAPQANNNFKSTTSAIFFNWILKKILAIMEEIENSSKNKLNWLAHDAARIESIKKAGTFRRAWMHSLQQRLVPVLAAVVAFLDTNYNLNFLQCQDDTTPWLQHLWFDILQDPELCHFGYKDLQTLSTREDKPTQFTCRNTFYTEPTVSAMMPFSWLMLELIDSLLPSASKREENTNHSMETSFSHHLQKAISSDEIATDFFNRYAADLLHTRFRLTNKNHELLMQCLKGALKQAKVFPNRRVMSQALIEMHRVFAQVKPRLLAVLDMVACHPDAIQNLQEKINDPKNPLQNHNEMTEDVLLLSMLVEEVCPQKNQLITDDGCMKWLDLFNKVAPVISRVMADINANTGKDTHTSNTGDIEIRPKYFPYGPSCREELNKVRCTWTRVTVVKLFVDYMSPLLKDEGRTQVHSKRVNYNLLWTLLGEKADLKTKETLENVDSFLNRANSLMVKYHLGDVTSCKHCKKKLDEDRVQLPCHHMICNKCYEQIADQSKQCPECKKIIPENTETTIAQPDNGEAVETLVLYQRQTSSFLMALVSQLCFSGGAPPQQKAIEHIFSYVKHHVKGVSTIRTQQLTLLGDQIDRSPVLRSFILRLLLKNSETVVSEQISNFLENATQTQGEEEAISLRELSLLVIYCTENLQHEKEAICEKRNSPLHDTNSEQCIYVTELLTEVRSVLDASPLELPTLISLGRLRYILESCARILFACVIQPVEQPLLSSNLKSLMRFAGGFCEMGSNKWPKKFLIKQLCRAFGVEAYNTLIQRAQNERCLEWIGLEDVNEVTEVPDRYLICGENYQNLRAEVTQSMRGGGDYKEIIQILKSMKCKSSQKEYILSLALHREVIMACLNSHKAVQEEIQGNAQKLLQFEKIEIFEGLANCICTNTLGSPGSPMRVQVEQSLADQSMACVLIHFWLALRARKLSKDFLHPLLYLINDPEDMLESYLPSMPQDNVDEVILALSINQHDEVGFDVPRIWECPNGHRYLIGDCGNPVAEGKCPECNVKIGGEGYHVPAEGNREGSLADRTQTGHTLGAANDRNEEAVPERKMSAIACAVVRFFTHAALFLGVNQEEKAPVIAQIVRPPVDEEELATFFWKHLHCDLLVLGNTLHKCCDDVFLLLHYLCHQFAERKPGRTTLLITKDEREQWESVFTDLYVNPALQHVDDIIRNGNQLILNTRQGQNQLLNLIFEVGEDTDSTCISNDLQQTAAPWKYRTRISVDHFFNQFELHAQRRKGNINTFPVLRLFHTQRHHLQALFYVPEILELQRNIMQQFHRRMYRDEASKCTIDEMLQKNGNECEELKKLLDVFSKAWDIVKDSLTTYSCVTEEKNKVHLPTEFHNVRVTGSSPIAMLLPATRGPGLCAYILIHYLFVQHNSFMENYCPLVKQKYAQLPQITVHAITKCHLLGYTSQSELLPLVLAHCNYSLHLGHSDGNVNQLDYDFHGFELQLRNTLLQGKSRIQRHENGSFEIETMVYGADITISRLLTSLRSKIDQVQLRLRDRREIAHDLRESMPDISQSIDNLNTALSLLISQRTDPNQSLSEFMTNKLMMREAIHSQKAQRHCYLKHVQSLWLLLCMQRAHVLAIHHQEAFDGQGENIRKKLSEEQKSELEKVLIRMTPEHLDLLLWQIFECILLYLMQQDGENYANPDNYSLHWLVCANMETPLYAEDPEDIKEGQLKIEDLDNFPQTITASQAIETWLALHSHLSLRLHPTV